MICHSAILIGWLLTAVPVDEGEVPITVRISALPAGQMLRVETEQRVYRIKMIDGETGESLVAASFDGQNFGEPERMFLLGSTRTSQPNDGGLSVVVMGELQPGRQIEWGRGSLEALDRGVTSVVRSIEFIAADVGR